MVRGHREWEEVPGFARFLGEKSLGGFLCLLGQGQCDGRVPPSEPHPWLLGRAPHRAPKVNLGSQRVRGDVGDKVLAQGHVPPRPL